MVVGGDCGSQVGEAGILLAKNRRINQPYPPTAIKLRN